ncbi:hypothetical protein [Aliiroseovarius marinus]|uniref:hypothetical protein n=1 Tax=Aliiroseovarius marinus TaxID=2500159 RepID=UPI003D7F0FFF
MSYADTAGFKRWAKSRQRAFFEGIYDQVKGDILDVDQPVTLPIDAGSAPWRRFTVTLMDFMVMAQYVFPGGDEDPNFVGTYTVNNTPFGFAVSPGDIDTDLGKVFGLNHKVLTIENLDIGPVQSSLYVKAFDTSDVLVKKFLGHFHTAATSTLNGVTAPLPFGSQAQDMAAGVMDKLVDMLGSPTQKGGRPYLYTTKKRMWIRPPDLTYWRKFKFIAFVEDDPGDPDHPYKEIYLTLWKLELESRESMEGNPGAATHSAGMVPVKKTTEPAAETETPEAETPTPETPGGN